MDDKPATSDQPPPVKRPRRRWRFQFSLRTLFVVVTVFCVGSGWFSSQVRIVHERKAMRAWVQANGGAVVPVRVNAFTLLSLRLRPSKTDLLFSESGDVILGSGFVESEIPDIGQGISEVSLVRRFLGDEAFRWVVVPENTGDKKFEQIKAVFAEARVESAEIVAERWSQKRW